MRVVATFSVALVTACVPVASKVSGPAAVLRVTNGDRPFRYDEGAPARKVAEAACAAEGKQLRTGTLDRFEGGAWVYPGGCA